jgi:hypothetical protein
VTERLSTLLHEEALDLPVPAAPAQTVLTRGKRVRARRRLAGAVTLAAAVVVIAGTATGRVGGRGHADSAVEPVTMPPTSTATLLTACRDGNQSEAKTYAIFGAGEPVVKAVVQTDYQAELAIESADGSHWASCFVHPPHANAEFPAGMEVHTTAGTDRTAGLSYSYGTGCQLADGNADTTCGTFHVDWVDRRPDVVAAARVETMDGRTTTVPSRDGYLVFNYLAELPEGAPRPMDGDFQPLRRITFLDATGTPIAAQALDGSGKGEDRERVGKLPSLGAFPSQGRLLDITTG